MPKVTIIIEDKDDEVMVHGSVEPFMTEDKTVFSTAEIIGMYLQQHMSKIMGDAVKCAQTPDPVEEVPVKEPSRILLPGASL